MPSRYVVPEPGPVLLRAQPERLGVHSMPTATSGTNAHTHRRLLELQARAGNAATRSMLEQSAISASGRDVIRRTIAINGVPTNVAMAVQALANLGVNAAVRAQMTPILNSWAGAVAVHDFATPQLLRRALRRALQMPAAGALVPGAPVPVAIPAIFRAANLNFVTQAAGRLQTLYFTLAGNTGRLRQQHDTGPLAKLDAHPKRRVSFATPAERAAVRQALTLSSGNGLPFVHPNPASEHDPPVTGEHLLEYGLDAMGVARPGTHPSGGLVVNPAPAVLNNNAAIAQIYADIVGR